MPALTDRVKALDAEIESTREEAQEKWQAFDELRTELAESDADISDENSEAFTKAHEAHAEYGILADKVEDLKGRREKLWAMESERGTGGSREERQLREAIKDGLSSHESYGDRIVAGEAYKQLRDAGEFTSTGRLGNTRLGQMMSREELVRDLHAAVVVTDESADDTVRPLIEPMHRGLVDPRYRPLLITDLITVGTTDSDSIDYVVETGWVNNAAGVPEATTDAAIGGGVTPALGGVKPQSRLSFEKRDESVKTIAHWVAATKKALSDVARLRTTIDTRLRRGLADVLEDQIIAGDAVGENLRGILNTPGVQHQERGAGPLVDDVLRGMTKVRLAFFDAVATALNPLDFEAIRLMRDDSGAGPGTGAYLFGPPSQAGATTLWGAPVVQGPQFPEGQPVTGDFRVAELYIREGVQVLVSDSHADFFVRNLVAILAEMRAGLVIPQPEGLCEISEESS